MRRLLRRHQGRCSPSLARDAFSLSPLWLSRLAVDRVPIRVPGPWLAPQWVTGWVPRMMNMVQLLISKDYQKGTY
jgi:hypothetical protein